MRKDNILIHSLKLKMYVLGNIFLSRGFRVKLVFCCFTQGILLAKKLRKE